MLFSWTPVPGMTTPEPDPVDAVSEAALPRASTTEMWVVPRTDSGVVERSRRAMVARVTLRARSWARISSTS